MALPKLNDSPQYDLVIPSTQKEVRYRPFLVKEQKVLLLAGESQDKKSVLRAIMDTIGSCVENVNINELTTYDVDYMFTMIRTKSVGESSQLMMQCSNCSADNEVSIRLDDIKVEGTIQDNEIKLTDDITVKMKHPSYDYFLQNAITDDTPQTEVMMELLINCIDTVATEDEVIAIRDEPREEVKAFIDSLTTTQFEKLTGYLENMPSIKQDVEFYCTECNHHNERQLKGLEDFF